MPSSKSSKKPARKRPAKKKEKKSAGGKERTPEEIRAARQSILDTFLLMLKPNPRVTVSEYSDGHLYIPPPAQFTGHYRTSLTPYAKEMMDECSPSSPARDIIICTGTQMSKTQIALNVIAFHIENDPTSMLIAFPNDKEGKHYVRTRIDPMIDYNPALKARVGVARGGGTGNTVGFKEFPGGFLKMASGEAANSLKSTPCRIVIIDEYDGFPRNIEGQGSGKSLAEQRTVTYRGREKVIVTSTPTNEDSQILLLLEATDKRKYFLTSPKGVLFEIEWENFRWKAEDTDVKEVWYELGDEIIYEHQMKELIDHGIWIPTQEKKVSPTSVGFWISGLYNKMRSWRDTVRFYLDALNDAERGDFAAMTSFYNNILALPYTPNTSRPNHETMMLWANSKNHAYHRYQNSQRFSEEILFLTSGTDVQENRLETEVKGWCRNGKSISVDHYIFPCEVGKTTMDLSSNCWREYREKILTHRYIREDGVELGVALNAIDRSFIPETVQAFAASVDPRCERVIPVRGTVRLNSAISDLKIAKMTYPGNVQKTVMYRDVGVSRLKGETYTSFRLPYDKGDYGIAMFSSDYDEEYFLQLTSEEYQPGTAVRKGVWVKIRDRNEALDLHVYNLAMWYLSGAPSWKESDYDAHEKKLKDLAAGTSDQGRAMKRYLGRQTFKPNLGV